MTFAEFEPTMMRMQEKWGKYAFDPSKFDLVYAEVKDLLPSQFRRMVDYFLGEDIRAKVSDFKRSAQYYRRKPIEDNGGCLQCDKGTIVAKNLETGYSYGFRCRCEAGQLLAAAIPTWENNAGYEKWAV